MPSPTESASSSSSLPSEQDLLQELREEFRSPRWQQLKARLTELREQRQRALAVASSWEDTLRLQGQIQLLTDLTEGQFQARVLAPLQTRLDTSDSPRGY